jgi:hypothetical protein
MARDRHARTRRRVSVQSKTAWRVRGRCRRRHAVQFAVVRGESKCETRTRWTRGVCPLHAGSARYRRAKPLRVSTALAPNVRLPPVAPARESRPRWAAACQPRTLPARVPLRPAGSIRIRSAVERVHASDTPAAAASPIWWHQSAPVG